MCNHEGFEGGKAEQECMLLSAESRTGIWMTGRSISYHFKNNNNTNNNTNLLSSSTS